MEAQQQLQRQHVFGMAKQLTVRANIVSNSYATMGDDAVGVTQTRWISGVSGLWCVEGLRI